MDTDKKNLYSKFSGVIELTKKDFIKNKLKHPEFTNKNAFVIFYAPWCGFCQKMVEYLSDLAIQFRYIFPIGVINCENPNNGSLCNQFKITGFPTIFHKTADNSFIPYTGSREKDTLISYIYNNTY